MKLPRRYCCCYHQQLSLMHTVTSPVTLSVTPWFLSGILLVATWHRQHWPSAFWQNPVRLWCTTWPPGPWDITVGLQSCAQGSTNAVRVSWVLRVAPAMVMSPEWQGWVPTDLMKKVQGCPGMAQCIGNIMRLIIFGFKQHSYVFVSNQMPLHSGHSG